MESKHPHLAESLITERRASEEVRGASSVVKDETAANERKSSDRMEVAGGTPAGSGTTPVEAGTPTSVNEPGADEVFNKIASFGKEAGMGVEPAASEIAGAITTKSSTLPSNDGATIPTTEPKVDELVTGVASLAKEERGAIEPVGSEVAGGIADSPASAASAGLVAPKLQPAVPKADQGPPAPVGLRIAFLSP